MLYLFLFCFVMILFFALSIGLRPSGEEVCRRDAHWCQCRCGKHEMSVNRAEQGNLLIRGSADD